jgi:valyl-tRNA synthetase
MEPLYKPQGVEERWQRTWEEEGLYNAEPDDTRETFVIALPPPNVTGELHMGHALNASIQDLLIRWHRMRGFSVLWQPGYDHAGIATQNVVEKELAKEGLTRHDLGRERFLERTWAWLEEYGGVIMGQLRRLGASLDYRRERMTMDEAYVRAVLRFFVHLHERGPLVPGESDRELVPALRERDLRPRGRPPRNGRLAELDPLPACRRDGPRDDRDRPPADDARRRRGRRPPGR